MGRKKSNVEKTAKKKKKITSGNRGAVVKKKRSEKNYTVETLQAALNAIGEGQTLRQAAHSFGIPKSTLFLKSKGEVTLECRKGPKTVLSAEEENNIAMWIVFCADNGFPVTKTRLLDCVQKYFNSDGAKTPFKNNRPGHQWYRSFMKRHPNLSTRIAQNLTSTRAAVNEEELRNWFTKVKKYLEEKNLLHVEPHRVFNLDESAFMLVPKDNKVITQKGVKAPYQIVSGNEKASLTVLFTVAASGDMPPPMILFDLKTMPKKNVLDQIPRGWGVGNTERGWMTADSFLSYIKNVFYKWLQENNYVFPIILYVDGHSSHMTLPLLQFCKTHQIELIVLYPNATHIIQPLDVAVFHPLKESYRKVLRQWRIDNDIVDVKKHMFAPILKMALDSSDLTQAIKNGFRACGLYPFNVEAVNYNVLSKKSKKKDYNVQAHLNSNSDEDSIAKNREVLAIVEKNLIPQDILESFKEAESQKKWNGDVKYVALFESWCKLKKLCNVTDDSSVTDDQQMPDVDSIEVAANIVPEPSDESMLDASDYFNNHLDSSVMDKVDENSLDTSYAVTPNEEITKAEFPVSESEIELYDEAGNRITATVITVLSDDVIEEEYISRNSSPINTILLQQLTDAKVDDNTGSESMKSNSNDESSSPYLNISNEDNVWNLTSNFDQTITDQENTSDSFGTPLKMTTDTPKKTTFGTSVLSEHNSHLSINDESNSSTCSGGSTQLLPKLQKFFPVPSFTGKKKKKSLSTSTPSAAVVDDLLTVLEQKDIEKKEKEHKILLHKQEREKMRTVLKKYNENKKKNLEKKKELKLLIQNLKRTIKSENNKENVVPLSEHVEKVTAELEELENVLIREEMEFLQSKIKIKQEKCDTTM